MKFFSVLILSCSVLSTKAAGCLPDASACSDNPDIAKIKCSALGADDCTLVCPEGACTPELILALLEEPKIKKISPDDCRDKCELQANTAGQAAQCEFYRWQNDHIPNETHCSLQTTCLPDPTCGGANRNCFSGEIGCTDGHDDIDCNLKKAEWEHNKFHVFCVDKKDDLDINMYVADTTVSPGTVCQTVSMCAEWNEQDAGNADGPYARLLAVVCGNDGTWKEVPNTGSDAKSLAMIVEDQIKEPTCCFAEDGLTPSDEEGCTCAPLNSSTDDWGDLICENPLEGSSVTEPNSCILLCDNHLNKAFSCRLDYDGDKKWLAEKDGAEINDVKCDN